MTGLKCLLTDIEEFDGGNVAFAGNPEGGRITARGNVTNGKLVLEKVNLVPQMCYNLLSVSQVCDKNLVVVFNNTECLFVKPNFRFVKKSFS